MSEGGWIVLAAAVGAMGSILTTWLNAMFARGSPDYFDKVAMKLLKAKLSTGDWHELIKLANIVGLSDEDTKQLLLLVGARGHEKHAGRWGLVDRVGLSDESSQ